MTTRPNPAQRFRTRGSGLWTTGKIWAGTPQASSRSWKSTSSCRTERAVHHPRGLIEKGHGGTLRRCLHLATRLKRRAFLKRLKKLCGGHLFHPLSSFSSQLV